MEERGGAEERRVERRKEERGSPMPLFLLSESDTPAAAPAFSFLGMTCRAQPISGQWNIFESSPPDKRLRSSEQAVSVAAPTPREAGISSVSVLEVDGLQESEEPASVAAALAATAASAGRDARRARRAARRSMQCG